MQRFDEPPEGETLDEWLENRNIDRGERPEPFDDDYLRDRLMEPWDFA